MNFQVNRFMFFSVLWFCLLGNCSFKSSIADSNSVSIKPHEDYIEACNSSVIIVYDSFLPIYDSSFSGIVEEFRFEDIPEFDFGKELKVIGYQGEWLRVDKDVFEDQSVMLKGDWIHKSNTLIYTNNYNNEEIPLKSAPKSSSLTVGFLSEVSSGMISKCDNDWLYVEFESISGWLSPDYQCSNDVTNCN